ncbi:nucleoside-diphosphate kinase [Candidatus Oleimmundimicrobium sp.]|uniref:nucleoside-diphosphate kinase n=1 Tax=Candidatus Oleimmundimicrobium sp. TaxID=3060597 RepID=UPI0027244226|nr:nucleoside-diphosphate kinase [Candidatus Oleimmundimicrobium sp.]MDO8886128.1 nucleoside-diphosphate kinase [Candidatus Oleimmundimicrobium sp.]
MILEKTFLMIKPDGVRRRLVGEIIKRIEDRGLNLESMKLITLKKETAEENYVQHKGKPFFNGLIDYVTSGPVVIMVASGENAVSVMRKMMGATNPLDADPGTIRGDFALDISENIIHGSDSVESADREISLFFK